MRHCLLKSCWERSRDKGAPCLSAQNHHPYVRPSPGGGSETNMYSISFETRMSLLVDTRISVHKHYSKLCSLVLDIIS